MSFIGSRTNLVYLNRLREMIESRTNFRIAHPSITMVAQPRSQKGACKSAVNKSIKARARSATTSPQNSINSSQTTTANPKKPREPNAPTFGPHAPSRKLRLLPNANITAPELAVFFPEYLRSRDPVDRLFPGKATHSILAKMIKYHRFITNEANLPNLVLKMTQKAMREGDRHKAWNAQKHHNGEIATGNDWSNPNNISMTGLKIHCQDFPDSKFGGSMVEDIPIMSLGHNLKCLPDEDTGDGLDLVRVVAFASGNPHLPLQLLRDYSFTLSLLGGPRPVQTKHQDEVTIQRWAAKAFDSVADEALVQRQRDAVSAAASTPEQEAVVWNYLKKFMDVEAPKSAGTETTGEPEGESSPDTDVKSTKQELEDISQSFRNEDEEKLVSDIHETSMDQDPKQSLQFLGSEAEKESLLKFHQGEGLRQALCNVTQEEWTAVEEDVVFTEQEFEEPPQLLEDEAEDGSVSVVGDLTAEQELDSSHFLWKEAEEGSVSEAKNMVPGKELDGFVQPLESKVQEVFAPHLSNDKQDPQHFHYSQLSQKPFGQVYHNAIQETPGYSKGQPAAGYDAYGHLIVVSQQTMDLREPLYWPEYIGYLRLPGDDVDLPKPIYWPGYPRAQGDPEWSIHGPLC